MKLEKVDELIARVEARHPRLGRAAMATYYEAVHQEIAPLARALEVRVAELENEAAELRKVIDKRVRVEWVAASAALQQEREPREKASWACPKCRNVYTAGDDNVTIYAEFSAVYCRICNPTCSHRGRVAMERVSPECPKKN